MIAVLWCVSSAAWVVQPAGPADIKRAAAASIDEFEKLPQPFLPFPGWQEKAREDAISQWSASREALLADSMPHALLVALRNEDEAGRYFEGVDDGLLGFAELGLLPAPPEKKPEEETAAVTAAEAAAATAAAKSDPELFPYLANLAVKSGARRLGLGKELVVATERKAVELGFDRMYIKVDRQNFDARRLYDKLGYQLVYLQPRTDPRKGPPGANLFLRKDGLGVGQTDTGSQRVD